MYLHKKKIIDRSIPICGSSNFIANKNSGVINKKIQLIFMSICMRLSQT